MTEKFIENSVRINIEIMLFWKIKIKAFDAEHFFKKYLRQFKKFQYIIQRKLRLNYFSTNEVLENKY